MKLCSQCNAENKNKVGFCKKCGQRLPSDETQKSYRPAIIVAILLATLFIAFLIIKILSETGVI
jgi:hypothetical protein